LKLIDFIQKRDLGTPPPYSPKKNQREEDDGMDLFRKNGTIKQLE
jgi:hypothetical protein